MDPAVPGPSGMKFRPRNAADSIPTRSGGQRVIDTLEIGFLDEDEGEPSRAEKERPTLANLQQITRSFLKDSVLSRRGARGGARGGAKIRGRGEKRAAKRSRLAGNDYETSPPDVEPRPDDVEVASLPILLEVILSRLTFVDSMRKKSRNLKESTSGRMKKAFIKKEGKSPGYTYRGEGKR